MKKALVFLYVIIGSSSSFADDLCGSTMQTKSGDLIITQKTNNGQGMQAIVYSEDISRSILQTVSYAKEMGWQICAAGEFEGIGPKQIRVKSIRVRQ